MKKLLLTFCLLLLTPAALFAQGTLYQNTVQTQQGLQAGATITVCSTAAIATAPTGATESGTTVTITSSAPHGLVVGQSVQITGVANNLYNGTFTILTVPLTTTFTVQNLNSGLGTSGGGLVLPNNVPCTPTTTIYSDIGLVAAKTNPLTSDGLGNFSFFASTGVYAYTISGAGILASSGGPFLIQLPIVSSSNLNLTGSLNVSGAATFQNINGAQVVGNGTNTTIALACTAAGTSNIVEIPGTYAGTDAVPDSCLGQIIDYRTNLTGIGPKSSHFRVGQIIASSRPILDPAGALVPLGADLAMFSEGAADLAIGVQNYQITSSTSVGAPGVATITLSSGGICGASPTACLYPGNVGHSGASVWINKYQADQETLAPRSSCAGLPVSTYCIASASTITGNFANAHTSTPYTVQQRGTVFWYTDTSQTLDTDNATPVFSLQHIGTTIPNRDWQICRGPYISSQTCTQKVIESGENGDHLPKFFGTLTSTSANIAQSGNIARMAATDCITWRNGNNNGDNCLQSNANNALLFGGTPIVFSATASTDKHLPSFSGTTGYVIQDSGLIVPTSAGSATVTQTIANGTATMTTALIATVACGTTVTVAATGVLTTDVIDWSVNAAVTAANNGLLILKAWPTAGNVNFNYCNPTAAGVTPTATTVNWSVRRP